MAQTRPFMSVAEYKGRGFYTHDDLVSRGMTAEEADRFIDQQNTATPGRINTGNIKLDENWEPIE